LTHSGSWFGVTSQGLTISWEVSSNGAAVNGFAIEVNVDYNNGKTYSLGTLYTTGSRPIGADGSFAFSGGGQFTGGSFTLALNGVFTSPTAAQGTAQVDLSLNPAVDGATECHTGPLTFTAKANA
jgi:hypothetical protein